MNIHPWILSQPTPDDAEPHDLGRRRRLPVARGLAADGIVAELRQRLREARRGDAGSGSFAGGARSGVSKPSRRRRVGPNESALKRPLSSYMLFAQATRAEIVAQSDARLSVGEVGKALGARWKAADAAEKRRWEERARALKAAYDDALAEARAKDAAENETATETSVEVSSAVSESASDTISANVSGGSDRSGVSYYKVIDGARYDRRVLDDCAAFENVNGSVDLGEARRMYDDCLLYTSPSPRD